MIRNIMIDWILQHTMVVVLISIPVSFCLGLIFAYLWHRPHIIYPDAEITIFCTCGNILKVTDGIERYEYYCKMCGKKYKGKKDVLFKAQPS